MNTANWIPDLFMKRVMEDGDWTLFSPSDVPDLHDKFGKAFEEAYTALRRQGGARRAQAVQEDAGAAAVAQDAVDAVRDRASLDHLQGSLQRALPQQHVGVVHSSNLCTEITLNTSEHEIAVCNLGSVNLVAHMKDGTAVLDHDKLKTHRRTAMRMLDNVIDINYYAVNKARNSNLSTARWASASWASRTACTTAHALRLGGGGGVRRPHDGSGLLPRLLGLDRAGRGARPLLDLHRARCGTAASCRRTRSTCCAEQRGGYVEVD